MKKNKYLGFIKETIITMLITLLLGMGFGLLINYKQININEQLRKEYDELKNNYNILEEVYKNEQQELYDYINLLEKINQKNVFDVDGDEEITSRDYLIIKNYIMNKQK